MRCVSVEAAISSISAGEDAERSAPSRSSSVARTWPVWVESSSRADSDASSSSASEPTRLRGIESSTSTRRRMGGGSGPSGTAVLRRARCTGNSPGVRGCSNVQRREAENMATQAPSASVASSGVSPSSAPIVCTTRMAVSAASAWRPIQ